MTQNSLRHLQRGFARETPLGPLVLVFGDVLGSLKAHEVQRELHGGEVELLEETHADNTSVEVQGGFGVLDAVHGLLEDEVLEGRKRWLARVLKKIMHTINMKNEILEERKRRLARALKK